MILVVDNYDSFTFNLVQALEAAGADVRVVRNDAIDRAGIEALAADPTVHLRGIVVSPGPGDPSSAGVSVDAIRVAADREIPLLGVCLGMQSMAAAYGAAIVRAPTLVHGEASEVTHDGAGLLAGMPPSFTAARYHSLAIDQATLPPELRVTAMSEVDRVVMGIRHVSLPMEGVQFHPESVLTPQGPHLLANFLRQAGEGEAGLLDAATGTFATSGLADPGHRHGGAGMSDTVRAALSTVVDGGTLSLDEARGAMGAVMDGEATPAQLAALLVALRMRGETVDELAGFAAAMRDRVLRVEAPDGAIDVVGTGGDRSGTFNISTTAALVVAASGIPVAKHGNRAITSQAGSADVLQALGVRIDHDPGSAAVALRELGFAFMLAPDFHPAMKHAGPTRRELGIRTSFNLLGPLTNPAAVRRQVVGVGDPAAAAKIAEVARRLGTDRTVVVHGQGIDELPLDGSGTVHDVTPDEVVAYRVDPEAVGLTPAPLDALAGGSPPENAAIVEAILGGAAGPRTDAVLLNAAAGFVAAGHAEDLADGVELARATVASRAPAELLGCAAGREGGRGRLPARRGAGLTVAERPRASRRRSGVLDEIAARRRADIDDLPLDQPLDDAPPPRPIAELLAAPGLHVIAEVKRSSPSAGTIATVGLDIVAQARAYEAGGAAAISVLCEPHWFGGSVEDLAAVRQAVRVPVLAKEFIVDARQLTQLRAAGADAVLLIAAMHPPATLARLASRALALGLEPLVEVHAERELRAALATGARLIGLNNRDLRTLEVDPDRALRLRDRLPDDRLLIAESGVRDTTTIRRWRAAGFDAALVGEALMRAADPGAAVASFVAAGAVPADITAAHRTPTVKICGITDVDAADAAIRAGADAVGLNLVPGTPRVLDLVEASGLARHVRAVAPPSRRPRIVAITVDRSAGELMAITAALEADAVQLNGDEPLDIIDAVTVPVWKALRVGRDDAADAVAARARRWLDAGAERVMLDAAGGPHPGGTGIRIDEALAAAVARDVPITLAGGLDAGNVARALRRVPAIGVDVASGVEAPRTDGARPRKDPLRVALFIKRARAARFDRPNLPAGPSAIHPGLVEADGDGHWGVERDLGGRFVPETLVAALEQLETAYAAVRDDPIFWSELRDLLATFAGRPTSLYRADRLADEVVAKAARSARDAGLDPSTVPAIRLYLKREDLAHTGAHKINNALGQALLTRRLGKTRVIAETGAGQHGVATATACALLGLPCVVYMGEEDIRRQAPNVLRMRALGAEVRSVTSGTATLKDAINEAMRDWVTNVQTTHYVLGSAMGPHPYPTIVRDLQRRIGDEAAAQVLAVEGRLPDLVLACVGGGSNAIGLLARFIGEPSVRLAVAEAAGDGIETGRHAAAIAGGTIGILHGARSLMLQDRDGQVVEAHSASAGLDYPGVGPQIAALAEAGRIAVATATDREAVAAMRTVTRSEAILPALETSHAIAALPKLLAGVEGGTTGWPADALVLVGFSGRGDKDLAAIEAFADVEAWEATR